MEVSEEQTTYLKPGKTFEEIYENFRAGLLEVAGEALRDLVAEYLPHAESDLHENTYYRAMDYIAGIYGDRTFYGSLGKKFRQKIFEENKELLIMQLNQDALDDIESLKRELRETKEALWRRPY